MLLIPVLALGLYLFTAYPEPGWIDSGELAAVAHTLGIAHPPGSPLYVLLTRLMVVVLPGSFFPLTFLSALAVFAGLVLLTRLPLLEAAPLKISAGAVTALIMAMAPTIWKQAIINEVYAVQFFMYCLFLFLWSRPESAKNIPLLSYLAGLTFAVHQSAIFLAPFLLERIWPYRRRLSAWMGMLAGGLFGVTIYLYMPIRSALKPILDWGGTDRWSAFIRHFTGWQYSSFLGIHSIEEFKINISLLAEWTWHNFPLAVIPVAFLGTWYPVSYTHLTLPTN